MATSSQTANLGSEIPQVAGAPMVDPKTGLVTQAWLYLFIQLWRRTGGASGETGADDSEDFDISAALPAFFLPSNAPETVGVARSLDADAAGPVAAFVYRDEPPDAVSVPSTADARGDNASWSVVAKANLPTPSAATQGWTRYVSDATGAVDIIPAYCTTTQWRRFSDDSVVN